MWTSIVQRFVCIIVWHAFFLFFSPPQTLGQLTFHPELTERLGKMVAAGDFPHLLFYGPSGAGKKTRVSAVLREVYGASVEKVKIEQRKVLSCQ